MVKPSKISVFGSNMHKKGFNMNHAQLSETFLLSDCNIFWQNNESFSVYCVMIFVKKGHFQLIWQ